MLKYEIYEKQRWSFMSWSNELKKEDGVNWVKKGNNKNIYCDKNKIKLPGDEYEWKNEWEVEITNNTDKDGWEYSKNFDLFLYIFYKNDLDLLLHNHHIDLNLYFLIFLHLHLLQ